MWRPDRMAGLILLNVAYRPPSGPFDLETALQQTEKLVGMPLFAYWDVFAAGQCSLSRLHMRRRHVKRAEPVLTAYRRWTKAVARQC